MDSEIQVSSKLTGYIRNVRRDGRPWQQGDPDLSLVGELALAIPLVSVSQKEGSGPAEARMEHQLATVRLWPVQQSPLSEEDEEPEIVVTKVRDGTGSVFIQVDRGTSACTLRLSLFPENFEVLWELAGAAPLSLRVDGELIGTDYTRPLVRKDSMVSAPLRAVYLSLADASMPEEWFDTRRQRELRTAWREFHYLGHSQVSRIVEELTSSAAVSSIPREGWDDLTEHVESLVMEARGTFRQPQETHPDKYLNLWVERRYRFEELLGDYDETKKAQLRKDFDFLWKHFPLAATIQKGEDLVGARAAGLKTSADELDELAHKLLRRPEVNSPTLEWALIDALVHAECLGLAQSVHSNKTMLGMRIAMPLEGEKAKPGAMKHLLKGLGDLASEGVALVATFALAYALAQGELQSTWVITTGITVFRWLRKAILSRELRPPTPGLELLQKMSTFYELFNRQDFNARATRDQLYRLSAEGAIFSPLVASLLDARVRREEQGVRTDRAAGNNRPKDAM